MDLSALRHHHFTEKVSQVFRLRVESEPLDLTLVEVQELSGPTEDGGRASFSLLFRGPAEPLLPQAIYPLTHEELGELPLFVVPLGPKGDGALYEVIFT